MRLTTRQTGIISYAGLDANGLWAAAKRALAQADEEIPERFASFLPIFPAELVENMSYVGSRVDNHSPVSPQGFSIDPAEYHQKLFEEMPELYQGDNYRRNVNYEGKMVGRGVVAVDEAWATRFPQYQPFMGERLHIYMIGGGHQAVAVPQSVYPRGGRMLRNMELQMRVSENCERYVAFIKRRMGVGEKYDPAVFEADYLRVNELLPVTIRQSELGHVMQDLCILRDLKGERPASRLFTENAKRAEGIPQYAPYRCACDSFAEEPVTRSTARLLQLCYEDDDFVSDLWLPYQDASEYIDKRRMALDVSALCRGFQLAPEYDPAGRCGRYPHKVRVAVVRDREARPMVARAINNPAYGGGMNPLGMLNRIVYLRDSAELLRQNRLAREGTSIVCENTLTTLEDYRAMVVGATAQELKGRLIDAMYRRESALAQMQPGTRAYERARELLDAKVQSLKASIRRLGVELCHSQLSGYDADIDYLERMARAREGLPEDAEGGMPFVEDSLRETSIESGYAMRNRVRHAGLSELGSAERGDSDDGNADDMSRDGAGDATEPADEASADTNAAPDASVSTNTALAEADGASEASEAADDASADTNATPDASVSTNATLAEADGASNASGLADDASADADVATNEADGVSRNEADGTTDTAPDKANSAAEAAPDASSSAALPDEPAVETPEAAIPAQTDTASAPTEPATQTSAKNVTTKLPRTPVQFEQLRMFGADATTDKLPASIRYPDGHGRASMAGLSAARGSARTSNPDGSMARMMKQKKKKKK